MCFTSSTAYSLSTFWCSLEEACGKHKTNLIKTLHVLDKLMCYYGKCIGNTDTLPLFDLINEN